MLRLYESPAEVLLGFDVDCCCVGYDGERVWALPRAVRAIQYGTNVLNPLHAWPSKASYEFRLVKYALRGYAISIPGLEAIDIDLVKILERPLSKLKGFARLVKMISAYESIQSNPGDVKPPVSMDYWGNSMPIASEPGKKELGEVLRMSLGEYEYAKLVASSFFYNNEGKMSKFPDNFAKGLLVTPYATENEEMRWDRIVDCSDNVSVTGVPKKLDDAWDSAKRSREYLNAKETDLDARYFAHAARTNVDALGGHGLAKKK